MNVFWSELIGRTCLVRRAPPFSDEPIREAVVAEVTPGGHVRLRFVTDGTPAPEMPNWYAPIEWTVLEILATKSERAR